MRQFKTLLVTLAVVCAGGLMALTSGVAAQEADAQVASSGLAPAVGGKLGAIFDLKSGVARILTPEITMLVQPVDSNGDGFFEAVAKVNLDPSTGYTKMCVLLDYEGEPTGFTLNIGDSVTNDGGGGDAGFQQRDAEMTITDQTLSVFASDLGGTPTQATKLSDASVSLQDGGLKVCVGDMFLSYGNNYTELDFSDCPPGADLLYALDGQPDIEGPVNYDLFVGLNRVIFDYFNPERIGAGLSKVYITLE